MRVRYGWINAKGDRHKCGECGKTSEELGNVLLMGVKFNQLPEEHNEVLICGSCLHDLANQAAKKQYELLPKTGMHYN